jgi:predicted secreted protein
MLNQLLKNAFMLTVIFHSNLIVSRMPAYSLQQIAQDGKAHVDAKSAQHRSVMHVIEGQIFTIILDCQQATGYTWYITQPPLEDTIQILSKTVIPCRHTRSKTKMIFKFKALQHGQETIQFEYAQPWDWRSTQQCTYTIIIHEKTTSHESGRQTPPYGIRDWLIGYQ